ncbi:unnamed protein product [Calicophoron daubneyi]|uniref:KASH domain-containing protein n=1 Tax=Calicophoron daubneyi TaxID=300641 RepID=A0AAV2T525_CALDB
MTSEVDQQLLLSDEFFNIKDDCDALLKSIKQSERIHADSNRPIVSSPCYLKNFALFHVSHMELHKRLARIRNASQRRSNKSLSRSEAFLDRDYLSELVVHETALNRVRTLGAQLVTPYKPEQNAHSSCTEYSSTQIDKSSGSDNGIVEQLKKIESLWQDTAAQVYMSSYQYNRVRALGDIQLDVQEAEAKLRSINRRTISMQDASGESNKEEEIASVFSELKAQHADLKQTVQTLFAADRLLNLLFMASVDPTVKSFSVLVHEAQSVVDSVPLDPDQLRSLSQRIYDLSEAALNIWLLQLELRERWKSTNRNQVIKLNGFCTSPGSSAVYKESGFGSQSGQTTPLGYSSYEDHLDYSPAIFGETNTQTALRTFLPSATHSPFWSAYTKHSKVQMGRVRSFSLDCLRNMDLDAHLFGDITTCDHKIPDEEETNSFERSVQTPTKCQSRANIQLVCPLYPRECKSCSHPEDRSSSEVPSSASPPTVCIKGPLCDSLVCERDAPQAAFTPDFCDDAVVHPREQFTPDNFSQGNGQMPVAVCSRDKTSSLYASLDSPSTEVRGNYNGFSSVPLIPNPHDRTAEFANDDDSTFSQLLPSPADHCSGGTLSSFSLPLSPEIHSVTTKYATSELQNGFTDQRIHISNRSSSSANEGLEWDNSGDLLGAKSESLDSGYEVTSLRTAGGSDGHRGDACSSANGSTDLPFSSTPDRGRHRYSFTLAAEIAERLVARNRFGDRQFSSSCTDAESWTDKGKKKCIPDWVRFSQNSLQYPSRANGASDGEYEVASSDDARTGPTYRNVDTDRTCQPGDHSTNSSPNFKTHSGFLKEGERTSFFDNEVSMHERTRPLSTFSEERLSSDELATDEISSSDVISLLTSIHNEATPLIRLLVRLEHNSSDISTYFREVNSNEVVGLPPSLQRERTQLDIDQSFLQYYDKYLTQWTMTADALCNQLNFCPTQSASSSTSTHLENGSVKLVSDSEKEEMKLALRAFADWLSALRVRYEVAKSQIRQRALYIDQLSGLTHELHQSLTVLESRVYTTIKKAREIVNTLYSVQTPVDQSSSESHMLVDPRPLKQHTSYGCSQILSTLEELQDLGEGVSSIQIRLGSWQPIGESVEHTTEPGRKDQLGFSEDVEEDGTDKSRPSSSSSATSSKVPVDSPPFHLGSFDMLARRASVLKQRLRAAIKRLESAAVSSKNPIHFSESDHGVQLSDSERQTQTITGCGELPVTTPLEFRKQIHSTTQPSMDSKNIHSPLSLSVRHPSAGRFVMLCVCVLFVAILLYFITHTEKPSLVSRVKTKRLISPFCPNRPGAVVAELSTNWWVKMFTCYQLPGSKGVTL